MRRSVSPAALRRARLGILMSTHTGGTATSSCGKTVWPHAEAQVVRCMAASEQPVNSFQREGFVITRAPEMPFLETGLPHARP